MTAIGSPVPTLGESGTLPAGVTFNASTGVLSGTPAAGSGGTYNLTFTASNGVGSPATQSFTLTVNQVSGDHERQQRDVHGRHAGSFTADSQRIPAGDSRRVGSVANRSDLQRVDGRAERDTGGRNRRHVRLTFTAANGVGPPAAQSFTLTVNQSPAITGG